MLCSDPDFMDNSVYWLRYAERPDVDAYWIGICIDTGHTALGHGPKHWIEGLAGRIITLHLHDNDGAADLHLPPGMGVIDSDETLADLSQAGYRGPLVTEARMPEGWGPVQMIDQFRRVCAAAMPSDAPGDQRLRREYRFSVR